MTVENADGELPQRQSVFKTLGNGILMTLAAGPALAAYHYRGFGNADPMWCSKPMTEIFELSSLPGNEFMYHSPALSLFGLSLVLMSTLHILGLLQGNSWMIAPYWAFVPSLALAYYSFHPCASYDHARFVLTSSLVGFWSLKSFFNYLRKESGELGAREDWRVTEYRVESKGFASWASSSLFSVYLPYMTSLMLIVLPFRSIMFSTEEFGVTVQDWIGTAMCLVGLIVNILADRQLAAYMSLEEKPYVLHTGLWRYSRHPNHFGDQLFWWGMTTMAVGVDGYWVIWGGLVSTTVAFVAFEMVEKRMLAIRERRKPYLLYRLSTPLLMFWAPSDTNVSKGELRIMAQTYSPHAKKRSGMPLSPASLDSTPATLSSCNVSEVPAEDYPAAVRRRLDFKKTFEEDMALKEADEADDDAVSFAISLENVAEDYRSFVLESEEILSAVEEVVNENTMPPNNEDKADDENVATIEEELVAEEVATPEEEVVAPEEEVATPEEEAATPEAAAKETTPEEEVATPEEEVASTEHAVEEEAKEAATENDEENIFPAKEDIFPANDETARDITPAANNVFFINKCLAAPSENEETPEETPEEETVNPFSAQQETPITNQEEEAPIIIATAEERALWATWTKEDIQKLKVVELRQIMRQLGNKSTYSLRKAGLVDLLYSVLEAERALEKVQEESQKVCEDVAVGAQEEEKAEEKEVEEDEEEQSIQSKRKRASTPSRKRSWTPSRRRRTQTPTRDDEEDDITPKKNSTTPRRKRSSSRSSTAALREAQELGNKKSRLDVNENGSENSNTNVVATTTPKKNLLSVTPNLKVEDMKCKELQVELKKRGESPWGLKKKEMQSILKAAMSKEGGNARTKLFADQEQII